jgi:hypothetical protein
MSWDKSVEAHRFLWIFVRGVHFDFAIQDGTMATFEDGGKWHNDFIIGAVGASLDLRKYKAQSFSLKFNAWMLGNFDIEYEDGVMPAEAIADLAAAFSVPNSILESVSDNVDNKYSFPTERV